MFYFTHLLYYAFFTLLIFHAPEFWKWVIAPLVIFVLEKLYRTLASFLGVGKSYIIEATVLASRYTQENMYIKLYITHTKGPFKFYVINKVGGWVRLNDYIII